MSRTYECRFCGEQKHYYETLTACPTCSDKRIAELESQLKRMGVRAAEMESLYYREMALCGEAMVERDKLKAEVLEAKALAFNFTIPRTVDDMQNTLDEQITLLNDRLSLPLYQSRRREMKLREWGKRLLDLSPSRQDAVKKCVDEVFVILDEKEG